MKRSLFLCTFLLVLLTACYDGQRRRMLALLDEADSLNRAYAQLPSDTLLLEAADFFDRHGSRNEQVRAHYLLGCAYRDQGQAPEALQAWHDAIDRADTTSRDDNTLQRLMAVYGQMAEMYHKQYLPFDELTALQKYSCYALAAKDTFKYIRNIELMAKPYFLLRDTSNMKFCLETAQRLYKKNGLHREAISIYGLTIHLCVEKGLLNEAKRQIDIFESQSGLFDLDGNICNGRQSYYYTKGLYYIKCRQLDSAEYFMRRLIPFERHSAFKGLMAIYNERGQTDSIVRFSKAYEEAIDSLNELKSIETVHQASSLYNYHLITNKAHRDALLASKKIRILSFVLMVALLTALISIYLYRSYKKSRDRALADYLSNLETLRQMQLEIAMYQKHEQEYKELIELKKLQVHEMENRISQYEVQHDNCGLAEIKFMKSKEYTRFKNDMMSKGYSFGEEEQTLLKEILFSFFPDFGRLMNDHVHDLSETEKKVCLLVRAHVKVKNIAILLDVSESYISHLRSDLLQKLFFRTGSSRDFDKEIMRLN